MDLDWITELDDGTGAKFVRIEIIHATWDDGKSAIWITSEGTQRYDRGASLQREQAWTIMASALRKDADAAPSAKFTKDSLKHFALVDMRGDLECHSYAQGFAPWVISVERFERLFKP